MKNFLKIQLFKHFWFFFILLIAFMNSMMKIEMNSKMSLFRLFLPLLFIIIFRKHCQEMLGFLFFSIFLIIYTLIFPPNLSTYDTISYGFILHYLTIPFCYFIMLFFIRASSVEHIYTVLKFLFKMMIVLSFIQFFFGGVYPNVQYRLPKVSIFFWNENELSVNYAVFIPLFFLKERMNLKNIGWIFSGIFFIVYNDARLLMIGLILFFVPTLLYRFSFFKNWFFIASIVIPTFIIFVLNFSDILIFGVLTPYDLFVDPIVRIIELRPYDSVGSLADRINAYVWGIIELKKSYFFGIGPGNSIELIQRKVAVENEEWAAKSLHNFLLQHVVELGFLGISMIIILFLKIKKTVKEAVLYSKFTVIMYYISVILMSTILSGAFGNYSFLFIIVFSFFFFTDPFNKNQKIKENRV